MVWKVKLFLRFLMLYMKSFLHVFKFFVLLKSKNDDSARKEFILNILLISSITLVLVGLLIHVIFWNLLQVIDIQDYDNNSLSISIILVIFLFLSFLYFLSRKGFFRLASYLFLSVIFLLAAYMMLMWGVDVNAGLLLATLIIVMSGVLISTRFAFVSTGIIAVTMIAIDVLQKSQVTSMNRYWRNEPWTQTDTAMTIVVFGVIATVSWLSNREIEKSLARARKSEAELKVERDSLEIKVEERTMELKEAQAEKMTQLYRFAEFGRLSSGLFHDLINPLNAVSLNIGQLKNQVAIGGRETVVPSDISAQAIGCVDRAVRAAKRLEDMVAAVRKQLARQENKTNFSLKEEIEGVISVLSHKAQKEGVTMRFLSNEDISLFGDAMKFNQVALNLIANAIDAYSMVRGFRSKDVVISLKQNGDNAVFTVKDWGAGIPNENKQKIFEPFFTTKAEAGGIGIGLSMTKRITEKDFGGDIEVVTKEGEGSEFVVRIPISQPVKSAPALENKAKE